MTKSKVPNHLHRYKRVNLSRKFGDEFWVYKCTKPLCSHYIRVELSEGKMCECNICSEPMIMTRIAMTLAKPHCVNCTKRKSTSNEEIDAIAEFLKGKEE